MNAGTSTLPLAGHSLVDTRSPEEARQQIGRIFCPHFLSPRERRALDFHAVHRSASEQGYSLNFVSYGSAVEIDPGELGRFFLLQIPLSGSASVRCGTETATVSAGRAASVLSPTLPTRMLWSAGCDKLIVLIAREAMQDQCRALAGRAVGNVEFSPAIDMQRPAGRLLVDHVRLMVESIEAGNALSRNYLARLGESLVLGGDRGGLADIRVFGKGSAATQSEDSSGENKLLHFVFPFISPAMAGFPWESG